MKSVSVIKWLLVPLFLFAAFPVYAGKPQAVSYCPFEIKEPGKYRLTEDLLGCVGYGVAIHASDVTLDLKGHTISCKNTGSLSAGVEAGMAVPVHGVKITNGTVTGCAGGILLGAADDSSVTKITSWGHYSVDSEYFSGLGIFVLASRNNVIAHNAFYDNDRFGISSLWSSGNLFKHNTSADNNQDGDEEGYGIGLFAETNSRIMCNRIFDNQDGIFVSPDSYYNLLRGNSITENYGGGIWMMLNPDTSTPSDNTVRLNIVENNGWGDIFEVLDGSWLVPDSDGICLNTWKKNRYGFAEVEHGCMPDSFDLDDVCALDDDDSSSSDDDSGSDDDSDSDD